MDWIDAAMRLGFPVLCAIAMGKTLNDFILRRETESAAREAALNSALNREREFSSTKLINMIVGYEKLSADGVEVQGRANTLITDMLAKRPGRGEGR